MAAVAANAEVYVLQPVTITGSGLTTNANYFLAVLEADGGTFTTVVSTDGSGAFTNSSWIPQAEGPATINVTLDPTSTSATTTATVKPS